MNSWTLKPISLGSLATPCPLRTVKTKVWVGNPRRLSGMMWLNTTFPLLSSRRLDYPLELLFDPPVVGNPERDPISTIYDDSRNETYVPADDLDQLACCLGGAVTRDLHLTAVWITAGDSGWATFLTSTHARLSPFAFEQSCDGLGHFAHADYEDDISILSFLFPSRNEMNLQTLLSITPLSFQRAK